jgi:MFS family permease
MPWYVISLAFSSEVSWRVKETTASGFFFTGVNILSILLSILSSFLMEEKNSKKSVYITLGVMAIFSSIGTIIAITLKPIEEDRIGSVHSLVTGSYAIERQWIGKSGDHYD